MELRDLLSSYFQHFRLHARAALEGAARSECDKLPLRVLRSRLAVFDEAGQAREPCGSGPAVAEAALAPRGRLPQRGSLGRLPAPRTDSSRTFTKCMDAVLAPLRLQGIRVLNYIDDWLILARSREMAVRHRGPYQPLQGVGNEARLTPEASLERLVPLVDYLGAWSCRPNISAWALHTVELGYRLQFSSPPPKFNGVVWTVVGPEQVRVMEQEVQSLLVKDSFGHRTCSSARQGVRVLQPVLHSSQEGWGVASNNRSQALESFSEEIQVQDAHNSSHRESDPVRGLVRHDRSKGRILPYFHPSMSQEVPEVRFLPFGLALSPRTFTKCMDAVLAPLRLQGIRVLNYIDDWLILARSREMAVRHRDVVLAHIRCLGLRLNTKKSVLTPSHLKNISKLRHMRTTFLGVVWDSTTMRAQMSPARVESIQAMVSRAKLGHNLTVKQFQRLLGLMAAASNVIPFGLLHMRPLQWWLRAKGFSPRGNPFRMIRVTRKCLRSLVIWRKPWFLSQGPVLGASCCRKTISTDASLTGWGAVMDGRFARGLWETRHSSWHINCLEMLAVYKALRSFFPELRGHHVLIHSDNTSEVAYLNHQGGLRSRPLCRLAHQILLWSQGKLSSLRAMYVPGDQNQGADILSRQRLRPGEWRLHPEVVEAMCVRFGPVEVDLFASQETSHCPLWFSLRHPAPLGLDAMMQTWPRLRLYAFPPIALLPGVLERVRREGISLLLVAPRWPTRVWFSDIVALLDGLPWQVPLRRDLLSQAGGTIFHPRPELWNLWVWPLRGLGT
ncbi:hypothetical protein PO909_020709 [Leuciscus waleckii]